MYGPHPPSYAYASPYDDAYTPAYAPSYAAARDDGPPVFVSAYGRAVRERPARPPSGHSRAHARAPTRAAPLVHAYDAHDPAYQPPPLRGARAHAAPPAAGLQHWATPSRRPPYGGTEEHHYVHGAEEEEIYDGGAATQQRYSRDELDAGVRVPPEEEGYRRGHYARPATALPRRGGAYGVPPRAGGSAVDLSVLRSLSRARQPYRSTDSMLRRLREEGHGAAGAGMTEARAATLLQAAWRRRAVMRDRPVLAALSGAKARLDELQARFIGFLDAALLRGDSCTTEKQHLLISELAMRVVLGLDEISCHHANVRALKKHVLKRALALGDAAERSGRTKPEVSSTEMQTDFLGDAATSPIATGEGVVQEDGSVLVRMRSSQDIGQLFTGISLATQPPQ